MKTLLVLGGSQSFLEKVAWSRDWKAGCGTRQRHGQGWVNCMSVREGGLTIRSQAVLRNWKAYMQHGLRREVESGWEAARKEPREFSPDSCLCLSADLLSLLLHSQVDYDDAQRFNWKAATGSACPTLLVWWTIARTVRPQTNLPSRGRRDRELPKQGEGIALAAVIKPFTVLWMGTC